MAAFRIVRYHFYKTFLKTRTLYAALFVLVLIRLYAAPFQSLCQTSGLKITLLPLFVLIGDNYIASGLLFCLWIWLVSEVPYLDQAQSLVMVRLSYAQWCAGTILFIVLMSLAYWVYILIVTIAVMIPHVDPSFEWGELFIALNRGAGDERIRMNYIFSKKLEQLFTAGGAFFISWSLHVLISVALALLVLIINLRRRRISGNLFALMAVFFDFCFRGLGMPYILYYFSPVSLGNMDMLDFTGTTFMPSAGYAYGFLAGMIALLTAGIALRGDQKTMNILA